MWRSASESKLVHSRYSRLSRSELNLAVSNWFRRRTSHSARLMWSTASEPGLSGLSVFFSQSQTVWKQRTHANNFLVILRGSLKNLKKAVMPKRQCLMPLLSVFPVRVCGSPILWVIELLGPCPLHGEKEKEGQRAFLEPSRKIQLEFEHTQNAHVHVICGIKL